MKTHCILKYIPLVVWENPPGVKKDEIEIKIKKMQNKHMKTLLKIIKNNVQVDNQEIMKTHCILKYIPLVVWEKMDKKGC